MFKFKIKQLHKEFQKQSEFEIKNLDYAITIIVINIHQIHIPLFKLLSKKQN